MITKCQYCGKSVKEVGRLNKIYLRGTKGVYGYYLRLCKKCQEEQKAWIQSK